MEMAKPTGLILRGGVWIVRVDVPKDLRAILGTSTLKRSLKTGDYEEACVRVHEVKAEFARKITDARKRARGEPITRQELTEQIKSITFSVPLTGGYFLPDTKPSQPTFTLEDAYRVWLSAKVRPNNSVVEVGRYVTEFATLNGAIDVRDYTREHWAAWRADCLERHGPGPTAFKRFSMMKTICKEAIRAGRLLTTDFHGADITLRKPPRTKLRNEGWLEDELKELWSASFFRTKDKKHPDANYWVPLICATTGARVSEVTGMSRSDAQRRHGFETFYLAKLSGKTEDSRRIIPVPQVLIDLGWTRYVASRPEGKLFDAGAKVMSQWFSRVSADLGLTRKGCDLHAFRHHIRTLLGDLECPDRVADYVTGHAPPGVSGTYGKTQLSTALRYLNQIDLGINVPKWKP